MRQATARALSRPTTIVMQSLNDPFSSVLNSTTIGGIPLPSVFTELDSETFRDSAQHVSVRYDVILQYQRTILDLQNEILHYRRLLKASLLLQGGGHEYTEIGPIGPLDTASINVLNSVLEAPIPSSAGFFDYEGMES